MRKKVLLRYSASRATEPILASVIKQTGVLVNILYANVSPKGGEILIAIDAPDADIARVMDLLTIQGVVVEEIKRVIELDRESCFHCGACVSLCPTGALRLAQDYSLEFYEDKCVYCEVCIPACPVRALKVKRF